MSTGIAAMDVPGNRSEKTLRAALGKFDRAIQLNPNREANWIHRAMAHANLGYVLMKRNRDPRPDFRSALEDIDPVLKRNPQLATAWLTRAFIYSRWGLYRKAKGEDPGEYFRKAEENFNKGIDLSPARHDSWYDRAYMYDNWAYYRHQQGKDPAPQLKAALRDYAKAIELIPSADVFEKRGVVFLNWSVMIRGSDPKRSEGLIRDGLVDLRKAHNLDPKSARTLRRIGAGNIDLGLNVVQSRREDPLPYYKKAIASLKLSIKQNPSDAVCWSILATAHFNTGMYLEYMKQDASGAYRLALEAYDKTLSLDRTLLGGVKPSRQHCLRYLNLPDKRE